MDKSTLSHICDNVYQGDKSYVSDGNGLGLFLVNSVVELFGGTTDVSSKLCKGSEFIVSLPLTRREFVKMERRVFFDSNVLSCEQGARYSAHVSRQTAPNPASRNRFEPGHSFKPRCACCTFLGYA